MRRLLVAAALGLGLIAGSASAAPVIGAAPAVLTDPVMDVQYRHHRHHRPHYRPPPPRHRRYYAPPPRHHYGYRPPPRHYGYRPPPPRHYGWR